MRDDITITVTPETRLDVNAIVGACLAGDVLDVDAIDALVGDALDSVLGDLQGDELVDLLASLFAGTVEKLAAFVRFMESQGTMTAAQLWQMLTIADGPGGSPRV